MVYRLIEHTADLAIEVTAASLEQLFSECLRAQTDCMTRLERVEAKQTRKISIVAPDLSRLLVDFLTEAIYLHETEGLVLSAAEVAIKEVDSKWCLLGSVGGEEFELSRHGLKTLLKAVTYHQISIERRCGQWTAQVIFDI